MAMLLVLLAVALAVVLAGSYVSSATIKMTASHNMLQAARARYLGESALQHALYQLQKDCNAFAGTSEARPLGPFHADGTADTYYFWGTADANNPGYYVLTGKATFGKGMQKPSMLVYAPPAYQNTVMSQSPVGYWRLGEISGNVADDATSDDYDLTVKNSVTMGAAGALPSDSDKAMTLDGANDYLTRDATRDLQLRGDMTVSMWFKMDSLPSDKYTLVTSSEDTERKRDNTTYEMVINPSGDLEYLDEYKKGRDHANTFTGLNISAGVWHNLTLTREISSRTIRVYLEGVQVGVWNYSEGKKKPTGGRKADLYIGSQWGESQFFKGSMDEVAIFDKVLAPADIQTLHDAGSAVSKIQIVRWNY
jgi:hypothetical protein